MTERSGLEVRDLLPGKVQMDRVLKSELCKDPGVAGARLAWGVIGSEASGALKSVLRLDVFETVASVWCVAKQFHEYTDVTKHPRGERSVVYLGEHKFVKPLYPVLTVTIGSFKSVSLRFTLQLAAAIRCAALSIVDGHIVSVGAAEGNVGAQLMYGDLKLNDLKTKSIPFPAHIDLKVPGLAIL
jgi:hypothetical protein